jgi:predicted esterase
MLKLIVLSVVLAALTTLPLRAQQPNADAAPAISPTQAKQSPSPAEQFSTGQLIESVVVKTDPSQTYALYLPSGYTPARKWPILYCFDPLARGAVPVKRFREAAEKYGWIVAGSNNSRNGPLKPSLAATAAMWDDTHARLSIDDRRVYTTGFSGGARSAIRVGYLCRNCLAGVIAVGAGFPPDIAPDASVPFPIFGVAGTNDYNFREMKLLADALEKFSVPHRFQTFDGAHAWAPKEVCMEAVEWMEIQAVRSGRREKDEAFVEELWKKRLARARAFEDEKKSSDAYKNFRALAADFKGLRDVTEMEKRAAQLREMKEVRKSLDEEGAQVRDQERLARETVAFLEHGQDHDEKLVAQANFRRAVEELRKTAKASEDTGARRVARRVLSQLFARYHEGALNLRYASRVDYALVASTLEIAAEIAPDNPQVQFELACAYAQDKEKKKALGALRRAVEKGFKDATALANHEALAPLRGEAEFKTILESLRKEQ